MILSFGHVLALDYWSGCWINLLDALLIAFIYSICISVQVQSTSRDALEDVIVFDVHSDGTIARPDGALRPHGRLRIRQRPSK